MFSKLRPGIAFGTLLALSAVIQLSGCALSASQSSLLPADQPLPAHLAGQPTPR